MVCGPAPGGGSHIEGPGISEEWDQPGRADVLTEPRRAPMVTTQQRVMEKGEERHSSFPNKGAAGISGIRGNRVPPCSSGRGLSVDSAPSGQASASELC